MVLFLRRRPSLVRVSHSGVGAGIEFLIFTPFLHPDPMGGSVGRWHWDIKGGPVVFIGGEGWKKSVDSVHINKYTHITHTLQNEGVDGYYCL